MEEVKTYTFKNICSKIGSGATPKGGKDAYKGGNTALIRSQNVLDFSLSRDGLAYINEEQAQKLYNVSVSENDVLLNITGDSVARVCLAPSWALPARVNQHVSIIRGKSDIVLNCYLLYYLQYKKSYLLSLSQGGATRNALTKKMIEDIEIPLPTISYQEKVISILSALDDKIELNRRINDNLEQQAQALFKAWFVDFEPFKDGKFVDSELGRIPENWRIGTIEELCQHIASGSTPSSMNKEYYNGNIKWFTTKELNDTFLLDSEKHISEKGHQSSSTKIKMFPTGTVLMAIYAAPTVGRLGILTSNATFNQAAVGLTPKEEVGSNYIFLLLKNERYNFNNLAIGAAQQNLSVKFIKTYTTIIPSKKVISDFNAIINSIFNRIMLLCKENSGLTNLRDTLLPKLMSGKLKIE